MTVSGAAALAAAIDQSSALSLVGRTPLVRLTRVEPRPGVRLYAKAEWLNPGGSVKDRPAARMIREGVRSGALRCDRRILDATSGNTGVAYAMIGASLGYGVTLCIPANASPERMRTLRAYGAELVLTDPLEGTDGAILEARRLAASASDRYFYPDQYNNDANWRAHFDGTGPEILAQTEGRLTHFVAGLGTSGTFVGVGRRLRGAAPHVRLVAVQPDGPFHGLEGLKHMPTAIVPGIYDPSLADEQIGVSTEEAQRLTRRLAAEQGLLVGVSSGAALAAALQVAAPLESAVIVVIFPDSGSRYLSATFWEGDPS
jgi:cysteine synthase B